MPFTHPLDTPERQPRAIPTHQHSPLFLSTYKHLPKVLTRTGRYGCPGKYTAMAVLRLSLAYMVWNFDWEFAPGDDGSSIWRKERWPFSRRAGPLRCVFRFREEKL